MYPYLTWMLEIDPWWVGALAIIGLYGAARLFVRRHGLPLLFGGWDIALLSIAATFLVVLLLLLQNDRSLAYHVRLDIWTAGFLGSLFGTLGLSFTKCTEGPAHITASLAAKTALLLLIPVVVIPILLLAFGSKSDRRYRDGTKNNQATAVLGLGGAILTWLVLQIASPSGSRR